MKPLKILGETILAGESKTVNFEIARLHTRNKVEIPVIIERAKEPGPTMLFLAGIHGDEINGTEIVRTIITRKLNVPEKGTIICIPVLNMFSFINLEREFPDGRDLNRVFPGSKSGSLASRFAYHFMKEIVPHIDYCIDFHTGSEDRFNEPQIRISKGSPELENLAAVFNANFTIISEHIEKSFRFAATKAGKHVLLFEGGKELSFDREVILIAVEGAKRVLNYLGMRNDLLKPIPDDKKAIRIEKSKWIRAKYSGLFHVRVRNGRLVEKDTLLGHITDPFGSFHRDVFAPSAGYIFCINYSPVVNQGDAIFHISCE